MIFKELIRIGAILLLDKAFTADTPSVATTSNTVTPLSDSFAKGLFQNLLRLVTASQFSFINGFATKQGSGLSPDDLSNLIYDVDANFQRSHPIGQFEPFAENWFHAAQTSFLNKVNPKWRETIQGMLSGSHHLRPTSFALLKNHSDQLVTNQGLLNEWKSYQEDVKRDNRLNFSYLREAVVTNKLIEMESNRIAASSLDAVQYLPARLLNAAKTMDRNFWLVSGDPKVSITAKAVYPIDMLTGGLHREVPSLPISVIPIRKIYDDFKT